MTDGQTLVVISAIIKRPDDDSNVVYPDCHTFWANNQAEVGAEVNRWSGKLEADRFVVVKMMVTEIKDAVRKQIPDTPSAPPPKSGGQGESTRG